MQLDTQGRGFSFLREGPLDMRMDRSLKQTAKEIINRFTEEEIGKIFRDYGEEPRWRKAAKAIVEARKKKMIATTTELAQIIVNSLGRGAKKKLHPATLIFQGLRIFVNRELEAIEKALSQAIEMVATKGRIGVISFHRLEDRIVKNVFKSAARPLKKTEAFHPLLKILTKKPIVATMEEMRLNPRARSAKMRFAEKIS